MTNQQGAPEALRLAEILEGDYCPDWFYEQGVDEVAAELRRLHAENERLAALVEAQQPAPSAAAHKACKPDMLVNGGALKLALNVLRRAGKNEVADELEATAQPSPTAQAAESAVLKAIREANMQLVRTGDNAFMLVPYKVATAQAAGSVPAPVLDSLALMKVVMQADEALSGRCTRGTTNWAAAIGKAVQDAVLAARAPADSVLGDAARLKARHDFLLWNRSLQPSPIESSVEYSVFDKALELYDAARKQGGA